MAPVKPSHCRSLFRTIAEPSWTQFYNDTLLYEAGKEPQLQYLNDIGSVSPLPDVIKYTVQNFPQFDLASPISTASMSGIRTSRRT